MALREEFEDSGNWLFRWRSYLPLLMFLAALIALRDFRYPYGDQLIDRVWELLCLAVSFTGIGIRMLTVSYAPRGTSGRNTKSQVAATLNTTGVYSVVRHPLYLGNFLVWFGIMASVRSWWFTSIGVLAFWIYYERIMFAEEEFLRRKFGEDYLVWAKQTPAFFPQWKNWKKPDQSVNLLAGIGSEYTSVFIVIFLFTLFDAVEDRLVQKRFLVDTMWGPIFVCSLLMYLGLRWIKKSTKLLNKR